ncbi:MAG TPA: hypothetical protein VIH71_16215, partial [Solirubrobacteraceae bacterium]
MRSLEPVSPGEIAHLRHRLCITSSSPLHLHFELWRGGASDRFDPQPLIETTWEYAPDPGDLPRTLVARNSTQ